MRSRAGRLRFRTLLLGGLALGACGSAPGDRNIDLTGDGSQIATDLLGAGQGTPPDGPRWQPVACHADPAPACQSLTHELPIPTHYSQLSAGFSFMAADDAALFLPDGLPQDYSMGGCYPVYGRGIMPTTDTYPADRYTGVRIADDEATAWAQQLCLATGLPVHHVFPPRADGSEVGQGPQSRACATQVVHARQANDSLYTVILPPGWDAAAPEGTYPILFNGHYDLHQNVFREQGAFFGRLVAHSALDGGRGVIGVLWNGGGAYASRTMSAHALDLAAQVIEEVAARYHGNRRWVVTTGGSRGGITALSIAANVGQHPYRVVSSVALVPPALIGDHARLGGVTFPALLHAVGWSTGLQDAWRSGWTYPSCAGRPELTGLTGWQAHLKILTGTSDPDLANTKHSLLGPAALDALVAQGTQIYLSVGEHDNIVPYAHQVRLGLAMLERGISVQAEVLVRGGHSSIATKLGGAATAYELHERVLKETIAKLTSPALDLAGPVPSLVTAGVRYHRVVRASGETEPFTPVAGYPFAVDLPYYAIVAQSFPIVVVGAPGTRYVLTATYKPTGEVVGTFSGTVPATMTETTWVPLPPTQPLGTYIWTARLIRPDGSLLEIPATATPTGAACTSEVIAAEPVLSAAAAYQAAQPPTMPTHPNTNWGLSEY